MVMVTNLFFLRTHIKPEKSRGLTHNGKTEKEPDINRRGNRKKSRCRSQNKDMIRI